jgi:hypothetical protein
MTTKKSASKSVSASSKRTTTSSKRANAKPEKNWRRIDVIVTAIVAVLIGYGLWNNFLTKPADDGLCYEPGIVETVNIEDDSFGQSAVQLSRCDRLKVVNNDDLVYDLAFGTHDKHIDYPGFSGQLLQPAEYFELDAVEAGTYVMHDHLRDNAKLTVTISD